jgi:hypothetical protein
VIDELVRKLRRPSERERKLRNFKEYAYWKAEDYRHFVLTTVGLVCSQRRFLPDIEVYNVLCYLANLVYLMYIPRVTEENIAKMRENMAKFVDAYQDRMGIQACTWKFHVFQHFIELILVHGSALFWDGYFRECVVGQLKEYATGTWNEDEQIVTNFLVAHHARKYLDACNKSPRMRDFYESEMTEFTGKSLTENVAIDSEDGTTVREDEREMVVRLCGTSIDKQVKRVRRIKHGGTVVTSTSFPHRGKVDDTWLYFNEKLFGQVEDMFAVRGEERRTFVVKLNKYQKVSIMDETSMDGEELLFPMNQFPAESTGEHEYVVVGQSTVIQKMSHGFYEHEVRSVDGIGIETYTAMTCEYLSVWPEYV